MLGVKKNQDCAYLLITSDWHSGHKLGLLNPKTELPDGESGGEKYKPKMLDFQEWIFGVLSSGIDRVKTITKGAKLASIANGDITHGSHFPSGLVSTRDADQLIIAADNAQEFLDIENNRIFRVTVGTDLHSFGEGTAEVLVVEILKGRNPKKDIGVVYHGLTDIFGILTDYSHHGPGAGNRSWLEGNVARFYLKDYMIREVARGRTPPHLVVRSHYHKPVIETVHFGGFKSTIIITPPLCAPTLYARKATQSMSYELAAGMILVKLTQDGGVVDVIELIETLDLRTKERWFSA